MGRVGMGLGVVWLALNGCVPELRIVRRDASADSVDVADDGARDATGADATTDTAGDTADAVGDAADVGADATDALADGAVGDATDDRTEAGDVTDASCATGQTACGGACVDVARDTRNCGRCGSACRVTGAEATCAAGVCGYATCSPGYSDCDGVATNGCEVDVRSAADNCGSCGNACRYANATPQCAGGSCAIAACATGYGNCDGVATNGCETDVRTSNAHCGACGHACLSGQSCAAGVCVEVQRSCATASTPGCGMVMVPGGTFTLGGDFYEADSQRGTSVGAYWLDRFEVTVARFRTFWEAGHPASGSAVRYPGGVDAPVSGALSTMAELTNDAACNWRYTTREQHPMNCVNWYTAMAFCVWDGGRLPTQAEWELAAAGTDGRHVPWRSTAAPAMDPTDSEVISHACVSFYAGPNRDSTCVVDSIGGDVGPSGAIGLYGNTMEWVADWYSTYRHDGAGCWPGAGRTDPVCLTRSGTLGRAVRGGADWQFGHVGFVGAVTQGVDNRAVNEASPVLGFRCARAR